jgi:hypothetical protein
MKKLAVLIVLAALIGGAIFWFSRSTASVTSNPQELAPAGSILYVELTDIPGSRMRWQETALAKIAAEPEVQAFFAKPLSENGGALQGFRDFISLLDALDPKSVFLALASLDENKPVFVSGFSSPKSKEEIEAALADSRKRVLEKYPAGKADLTHHEGVSIETFVADDFSIAVAHHAGWYLVASNVDLVKGMIDRADKRRTDNLLSTPEIKDVVKKAPGTRETLLIVLPRPLVAKLKPALSVSGQAGGVDWKEIEAIEAVAAWTTFDGANLREGIYTKTPGRKPAEPLKQTALSMTTPQTLLYTSNLLSLPDELELPAAEMDTTGVLTFLRQFAARLESRGIGVDRLLAALGNEAGVALDWPAGAFYPVLTVRFDVKDREPVNQFCQVLASGELSGVPLNSRKAGDADLYELPGIGKPGFQLVPALSLTSDALYLGSDASKVNAIVTNQMKDNLSGSETFKKAEGLTIEPNRGFAYIDFKGLFERVYGLGRTFLIMGAGFMPGTDSMDLTKLPTTEAISKHLGPIVYSQKADEEGVLMESVGPITTHQLIIGIAGGSVAAALKKQGLLGE